MRTSYSSLDTFKTCPLRYKFQDIDKIRAPKNVEQIFGGSIHSALKYMFERNPLYPTLDQVIDFFRNLWDQQKNLIGLPPREEDICFKEGISLLERFYKRNQPWNFNVVDMESRFEVDLENPKTGEKHVLAGIIDRIDKNHNDDSYEIIDYKTSRKMPGQDNIDKDLQMSIYHLGLIRRWPHLDPGKVKLSFYYLKHGEKISTSRDKNQLEETKKFILKTIDEIKERIKNNYDFPPLPSGLCNWCGYKQMCPMWKHLYQSQISKIKSQNDMEPVIKEYFNLKEQNEKNNERLDELKTLVYSFMDEQKMDRVFGAEGYLTRKVQEKISYDMEKIKDFLKEKIADFTARKQFTTLTASRKKIKEAEKEG